MDNKNTPTNLLDNNGQRITGQITIEDIKNFNSPSPRETMDAYKKAVELRFRVRRSLLIKEYNKAVDECSRLQRYTVIACVVVSSISLFDIVMNFNQISSDLARLFGL